MIYNVYMGLYPRRVGAFACALLLNWSVTADPAHTQTVDDTALVIETVVTGLTQPTTMAFVGPNDILVLQKANGQVRRVLNDVLLGAPVLDVDVNSQSERGLLGIAVDPANGTDVFLYYTRADGADGASPLANSVYRYEWNALSGLLENPTLLIDLPVMPGPNHDGGILVANDEHLYIVIGDLNRNGQLENFPGNAPPDDTAVILRLLHDGSAAPGNPFTPYCSATTGTTCTIDDDCPGAETCIDEVASYFAYGVRNSFGMTQDPVTGDLWNTENGPNSYDEVNRVTPGSNSGWERIMGPEARDAQDPSDLFDMPGAGSTYVDPAFSWLQTVAPTAILFPNGSGLGSAYDDVALVGDNNNGQIYRFALNPARTAFDFSEFPGLQDLVADNATERNLVRWGQNFGVITDLKIGPDGALYVVSLSDGAIYRIRRIVLVPSMGPGALGIVGLLLIATLPLVTRHGNSSAR